MSDTRRMALAAALGLLVVLGGAGAGLRADEEPLSARAFEVHYRPLADAYQLVSSVLSPQGKVTLQPRLGTLIVEDRGSVLDKVAALLASYDLPPRNVEITLSLFLGTDERNEGRAAKTAGAGLAKEVRGVLETLSDFTKWSTYEPLGSRSVTGVEGDRVVANLSEDYRVIFIVHSVHETEGTVKFERLQLQRISRNEDGTENVRDLYAAGAVVPPGRLTVLGAAKDPHSNQALFLTLQTHPR